MKALEGRAALIAGASQGLGRAIAEAYAREGASLVLCARDGRLLEEVRAALLPGLGGAQTVVAHSCDVSQPQEVRVLVDRAFTELPALDILVNCAGIYGPMGLAEDTDWSAWVKAVEINLFGAVLLCRALLPVFKERGYGKIIQLSGGGATAPLPRLSAYAASKAAVVRFVETLAEEVRDHRIDVNAIAPGALNTRMLEEVLAAGSEAVGEEFYRRALHQKETGGASMAMAAALAVFLASKDSDGITGKLVSSIWDPWEDFPAHLDELRESDAYTLRRIVPADRGKSWGTRR
jgi:NAD(P)-dependent dehydrogenase (short-subunit alcohol dehydrogenase family)